MGEKLPPTLAGLLQENLVALDRESYRQVMIAFGPEYHDEASASPSSHSDPVVDEVQETISKGIVHVISEDGKTTEVLVWSDEWTEH
jgi:hypothetical protein